MPRLTTPSTEPDGPRPAAVPAPQYVMLLSVWAAPGAPWRARLVAADASVHEFCSPLELARFVAHAPADGQREPPGHVGLR